jgi:Mrp family chromosome partitioning ATPase
MSGAAALAPLMGQVVMVVEAGRTSREVLTRALVALEHAEVTGVVLNKIRHRREGSAYGYAYGPVYAGVQPGAAA